MGSGGGSSHQATTGGETRFIALFWQKKSSFIFNTHAKRRSRRYKPHLPNVIRHARGRKVKKVTLFADHAPCHKTKNAKRFIG